MFYQSYSTVHHFLYPFLQLPWQLWHVSATSGCRHFVLHWPKLKIFFCPMGPSLSEILFLLSRNITGDINLHPPSTHGLPTCPKLSIYSPLKWLWKVNLSQRNRSRCTSFPSNRWVSFAPRFRSGISGSWTSSVFTCDGFRGARWNLNCKTSRLPPTKSNQLSLYRASKSDPKRAWSKCLASSYPWRPELLITSTDICPWSLQSLVKWHLKFLHDMYIT